MYICIYVCIYIYLYIYIHNIYVNKCIYIYIYVGIYLYIYLYILLKKNFQLYLIIATNIANLIPLFYKIENSCIHLEEVTHRSHA